ncbi:MAG: rhodanese-like domain-containing protein [Gammaproteobacteria bacterium]|nr:rhodanese-like domain-containing protein [Gammaproteobacteria bacterium]
MFSYVYQSSIKVLMFISMVAMTCTAFAENKAPEFIDGTKRVTAEEVVELVTNTPGLVIIDARKTSDRDEAGWIEGSVNLPDYDTTAESLAKHIPSKSTPVLFYCNGVKCGRSVTSSKKAVESGYTNIYWFRGGWEEWTQKGMPQTR